MQFVCSLCLDSANFFFHTGASYSWNSKNYKFLHFSPYLHAHIGQHLPNCLDWVLKLIHDVAMPPQVSTQITNLQNYHHTEIWACSSSQDLQPARNCGVGRSRYQFLKRKCDFLTSAPCEPSDSLPGRFSSHLFWQMREECLVHNWSSLGER